MSRNQLSTASIVSTSSSAARASSTWRASSAGSVTSKRHAIAVRWTLSQWPASGSRPRSSSKSPRREVARGPSLTELPRPRSRFLAARRARGHPSRAPAANRPRPPAAARARHPRSAQDSGRADRATGAAPASALRVAVAEVVEAHRRLDQALEEVAWRAAHARPDLFESVVALEEQPVVELREPPREGRTLLGGKRRLRHG